MDAASYRLSISQGRSQPGAKPLVTIIPPSPDEIRPLAFKTVIKKGKILKIKF